MIKKISSYLLTLIAKIYFTYSRNQLLTVSLSNSSRPFSAFLLSLLQKPGRGWALLLLTGFISRLFVFEQLCRKGAQFSRFRAQNRELTGLGSCRWRVRIVFLAILCRNLSVLSDCPPLLLIWEAPHVKFISKSREEYFFQQNFIFLQQKLFLGLCSAWTAL